MASDNPVVLVTGSGGRIGSAIAASLADACTVVGLERECGAPNCIEVDITSEEQLSRALETMRARYGDRIAAVVHLAAFYDFSDEPNPLYNAVNVEGTRKLLRALQACDVDLFIYASTMLVHAPGAPGRPINEASPLAPAWPYPQSKLAAERVVELERGHIKTLTLRLAGVYTDDCELPSLANQIQRIFERQALSRVFPGDASHGQSLIALDDVVDAVRCAIDRRGSFPSRWPRPAPGCRRKPKRSCRTRSTMARRRSSSRSWWPWPTITTSSIFRGPNPCSAGGPGTPCGAACKP